MAGKPKEMIGNRYGRLLVTKRTEKKTSNGCFIYECLCDCGKVKEISGVSLRTGNTKSCGCLAKEIATEQAKLLQEDNMKNLSNNRFGKLVALHPTEKRQSSFVVWKCECDCGEIAYISSRNLISGNTKSCGCTQKNNLKGKKFGMLTCLEPTEERRNRSILWKCKCDCGKVILMQGDYLKEHRFSSCGCNKIVDISDKKFGKLIAIKPTKERTNRGSVIWECKCECGKFCYVSENALENNTTKSCGCSKEESWKKVREKFIKNECVEDTVLCNLTNKKRKDNTSGRKGVYWVKKVGMWRVSITFQGKTHNLGYFKDFEKAVIAREEAEEKYFKPILEKYGRSLETTSQ